MNRNRFVSYGFILALGLLLPLASCGQLSRNQTEVVTPGKQEQRDTSCSYFYFLQGTHAEYKDLFPEALDAYKKALTCDPSADYIRGKLPLLLIKMGDIEQATELLLEAIEKNPKASAQRALLARIFIQQRAEEKAIEQYQAILSYAPENEQVLLRLGILLSQTEQYANARTNFKKLLELNQETYFARLYLARIANHLNEMEEAKRQYALALGLNWSPDLSYEIAELHLKNKQHQLAIEVLRQVLNQDARDERARLTIIQALLAMGNEEEAIAELSLAKSSSDTPERISMVLSRLYLRNGNNLKAEENLLAILETRDNSEARYLLAFIYLESENYLKALEFLEGIGPDKDEFEDAVFMKSKIFHQTDRIPEALAMFKRYLSDEQTRKPLFYVLASSLFQENDQTSLALDTLNQGIQIFPDDERLLFEYGLQLEKSNRLEEAISIMESIIDINPDHAEALNFVGYTWADTNRNLEKALEYIDRAMQLKPGNGYIQDSLGWIHFRLGNLERARVELIRALKLVPDDPNIQDHLGDVYLSLGLTDQALSFYQSAFEKFKDVKKKDGVRKKIETLEAP